MKAQVFLELVGKMMTAQGDYYASRKTEIKARQIELLIKSKDLEKLVRSVIKEGRLEADIDVPALQMAVTAEEHQLVKDMALDLSGGDPTPAPPQNGRECKRNYLWRMAMKRITVEKFILFLAASFAAYNFGLVGGYIEGTKFSLGGVIAGVVVNISLAIASSKYGSLNGKARTRQATVAFVVMLVLSPLIVAPVVFYSLPETFLGYWWLRAIYATAYPLVADMAIVAMGAVSGKALIALSEPTATQSAEGAEASAPSTSAVRKNKKGSADAVRTECAALSAQYACTEAQCGWSPSVDALIASAQKGKSAKSAAASAKAGHAKNKHPKMIAIDQSLLIGSMRKDGEK